MPFTLSHPAAILPLRGKLGGRLPFFALVAGSISPDIGYFFAVGPYFWENSHTFYRSFTFCLPMGLVLLLLYSSLSRGLLRLLPQGLDRVVQNLDYSDHWGSSQLPFTGLAVLVGSWTHIFWDSWTHGDGYLVVAFSELRWEIFGLFPLHRVLQHLSTFLGAIALIYFLRLECLRMKVQVIWRNFSLWFLWGVSFLVAVAFTYFTLTADWNYWLAFNDRRLPFLFVVSLVRNFSLLMLGWGVIFELRARRLF